VKSITTFHYPLADTRQQPSFVHDFEQSLLVWAVVAGLRAGPGPVHISTSRLPVCLPN